MKYKPGAIDKINTLDEAKEIIKMITGGEENDENLDALRW